MYAKLPRGFHIPTPVGNYSPDWAIAFYEGTVKHIYFIAETKGTMESLSLKPIEKAKISCARKMCIRDRDIVFIPGEMRAFVKEREISLTKNELKMLSFFLQNPKQILSKTQILENVFDLEGDFVDENTIAVNIRRLREKIEEDPAAPVYIKNIRGLGYISVSYTHLLSG